MGDVWRLRRVAGIDLFQCDALLETGLAHAFSTRRDEGGVTFDLGGHGPPGDAVASRRRRFLAAVGFQGTEPTVLRQVHGRRLIRVTGSGCDVAADGVVWLAGDPPGRVPSIRTADCVPLLIAERSGAAAAAVHAGWRGTAAGIVSAAVGALEELGVPAGRLRAALGPAIGVCCYEVGPEVAAALSRRGHGPGETRGAPVRVDLREANRRQLVEAGVPPEAIQVARECTACRTDLFFSHRAEGPGTGRMMASIGPATRIS